LFAKKRLDDQVLVAAKLFQMGKKFGPIFLHPRDNLAMS